MMDWSERKNIRKRGPVWEPFRKNSAFAADRQTSHGSKKKETLRCSMDVPEETKKKRMLPHRRAQDRELEAPTVANRALGLMLILG